MNTLVDVYDIVCKNAEHLFQKARFYLKGYHKFERPSVEEAIEAGLVFVDFKRGMIKNYHATHEPDQHIAYWSPQLEEDINEINDRFKHFKDEMYEQLHNTYQQDIRQEDFELILRQIEDSKNREFVYLKTENERIIRKYYEEISNYWLGFYYLKI